MANPRTVSSRRSAGQFAFVLAAAAPLAATHGTAAEPALAGFGSAGGAPQAPWKVVGLPHQTKPFTRFSVVDLDGRRAVKIEADLSYGNLVHPLKAYDAPARLSWQWRVQKPIAAADLREKHGDDTAVKVCVFFDLPMDNVPFAERQLLRLARGQASDPVPTATVCYVWDATLAVGTSLDNAFTRRMRYIVLESGTDRLDQWIPEKRDVGADFMKVFGDESKAVPPIIGVAVGADSDNTQSHSVAYVSGIALEP
ncbi:MAG: DUF3047 domain-containing protein [Rhizobacter sp.]